MDELTTFMRFVVFAIPEAIVIIACYRYLKASKGSDAKLLFFGSTLAFLAFIARFFSFYLFSIEDFDPMFYGLIGGSINLIGLAGAFLFAFGFLKLVKKHLKNFNSTTHDELNDIGKH